MSSRKKEVYIAFSGGGAKAIIHLGALNYIEDNHKIVGVSGTSAGAAIAALKAAGFTAKDIFRPSTAGREKGESKLFDRIRKRNKDVQYLGDLIGGGGIGALTMALTNPFRYIVSNIGVAAWLVAFALALLAAAIAAFSYAVSSVYFHPIAAVILSNVVFLVLVALSASLVALPFVLNLVNRSIVSGVAKTDRAIHEICHEIGVKMNITDRPVRMSDFSLPISIIATNISGKSAAVFSKSETPNVSLHDALSASICIPAAFPIHIVDGVKYIDGGIVSNVPAFVFSEEISLQPSQRVIALRITEEPREVGIGRSNWLGRITKRYHEALAESVAIGSDIISTVFTGTQDLAHGRMNIVQTTLPTPLRLLDFNLSPHDAATAFGQGEIAARRLILKAFTAEDIYNGACQAIANDVKSALQNLSLTSRKSGDFVRVAMAFRSSKGSSVLNLSYSFGFDGRTDWNMSIPISGSVCGEAWTRKVPLLNTDTKKIRSDLAKFPHVASRLDNNMQWILSVPILDPNTNETAFVINIDSNTKMGDYMRSGPVERSRANQAITEIAHTAQLIGSATLESIAEFKAE